MQATEHTSLLENSHKSNCFFPFFKHISKPFNAGGIAAITAGATVSVLAVLLPDDGIIQDNPGYAMVCLLGLGMIALGSGLIIRQRRHDVTMERANNGAIEPPKTLAP